MTLVDSVAPSAALGGQICFTAYLPPGYADASASGGAYPTLYLLHGRGEDRTGWEQFGAELDDLIAAGAVPPLIAVMPDAPWSNRGSWYVDSRYTGSDRGAGGPGRAVETALTRDLVRHVDSSFATIADRAARAVGGYSMGGAGALRFALVHPHVFSAALVLSPAVYTPSPPAASTTRAHGAFGVGPVVFDQGRYDELNYPAALAGVDPQLPVHLFVAAGDQEYQHPGATEARHDLYVEAATLHAAARRTPGVTSQLRVLPGGHDWGVWRPAFREGLEHLARRWPKGT